MQEKLNKNPDIKNLLEDGEEKYLYYDGGKRISILHGPKIIYQNNKEKYLYLVSNGKEGESDIWEAFIEGETPKIYQYVGPNRNDYYAELLAGYAAVVSKKI